MFLSSVHCSVVPSSIGRACGWHLKTSLFHVTTGFAYNSVFGLISFWNHAQPANFFNAVHITVHMRTGTSASFFAQPINEGELDSSEKSVQKRSITTQTNKFTDSKVQKEPKTTEWTVQSDFERAHTATSSYVGGQQQPVHVTVQYLGNTPTTKHYKT